MYTSALLNEDNEAQVSQHSVRMVNNIDFHNISQSKDSLFRDPATKHKPALTIVSQIDQEIKVDQTYDDIEQKPNLSIDGQESQIDQRVNLIKDFNHSKKGQNDAAVVKKNTSIQMAIRKTPRKSPVKVSKLDEAFKDIPIPPMPIIKPGELKKALKSIEHKQSYIQ